MGIKKGNQFLKEKCPEAFAEIPLASLKGHRLAIDACNWVYKSIAVSTKTYIQYSMIDPLEEMDRQAILASTIRDMVKFMTLLLEAGIMPVWCWDGDCLPEKAGTRKKRQAEREGRQNDIEALKKGLAEIPALLRPVEMINELKAKLCNMTYVQYEEMEYLKGLVRDLGIPSMTGPSEGEKLAAALAIEHKAIGVWSEDSDNYALGTPVMVRGFAGFGEEGRTVNVVVLEKIIQGLRREVQAESKQGFNHSNLVDFLIMCGTDFNDNMPQVGPKRAWDLIKKYGRIEAIAEHEPARPIAILNHQRVREIFAHVPLEEMKGLDFDRQKFGQIRPYASHYGIEALLPELSRVVEAFESEIGQPRDVIPVKPKKVYRFVN